MDQLLRAIEAAGVVGAGGAGFPTHVKYQATVPVFVINGVECEPLLATDKYTMLHEAPTLVDVVEKVASHLGAERVVIGIKEKNKEAIQAVKRAIEEVGSSLEIFPMPDVYPAGDEQMLVEAITGLSVPPGGLPLDVGAVVSNVVTLIDVARALEGHPVTERLVTIAGAVKRPGLVRVPLGTSLDFCLDLVGGATVNNPAILLGGPLMGEDVPWEKASERVVTKTTGGLIVLPDDHPILIKKRLPMETIIHRAMSVCIQCRICTDLCPRYLNGHPLYPHRVMQALGGLGADAESFETAQLCCGCGVCELYACPMGLSPKRANDHVKALLQEMGHKKERDRSRPVERHLLKEERLLPSQRLILRLGLDLYDQPLSEEVVEGKPQRLILPLRQHLGAPALPLVESGDRVRRGQQIASIKEGALGAHLHAPMDGIVRREEEAIVIERTTKEGEQA